MADQKSPSPQPETAPETITEIQTLVPEPEEKMDTDVAKEPEAENKPSKGEDITENLGENINVPADNIGESANVPAENVDENTNITGDDTISESVNMGETVDVPVETPEDIPAETEAVPEENAVAESTAPKIEITVKSQKQKETFEIPEDATIKVLKELVAPKFGNVGVNRLTLIFAGKILKDDDNLQQHHIINGLTVHLVIKSFASPPPNNAPNQPNYLAGLVGLGSMGVTPSSLVDMQNHLRREIETNPTLLQQILDNPLTQSLMSNPENMRDLITQNPQMQELLQRNPEVSHIINNPELLRQTMELSRSPATYQELLRTQDRAMTNLESLPGGYDALQRMYRDIQEPMLTSLTEQFAQNPFVTRDGSGSTPVSSTNAQNQSTASVMQQMLENSSIMQSMLTSPYMQQMSEALIADPAATSALLQENPLLAGNPALRNRIGEMMPQLLQQMQSPEMQSVLQNPEALNAIMQIQQGIEELRQSTPTVLNPSPTTEAGANNRPTVPPGGECLSQANSGEFAEFMARMVAGINQGGTGNENRYSEQVDQMVAMGFTNREANLRALIATFGDVSAAIDRILLSVGS